VNKTVVIHQPDFLPHLAFFHRLVNADLFVLLDTAQYVDGTSRSWTNRDKIKTPQGEKWLTVSVNRAPRDTPINQIMLSDVVDWRAGNLDLIRRNYGNAACFNQIFPYLEELYSWPCRKLVEFNVKSIEMLQGLFDISIQMLLAGTLDPRGRRNELLVDILKKVGGTYYLSGVGARSYFDPAPFQAAGIEVLWQDFKHPGYPQLYGPFVPYLSSIDLLFNCGINESRRILRSCE
jgi:hypothetical protein